MGEERTSFELIMKAQMNNLWPELPLAAGNRLFSRSSKQSEAVVTSFGSFVRWSA